MATTTVGDHSSQPYATTHNMVHPNAGTRYDDCHTTLADGVIMGERKGKGSSASHGT